MNLKLSYTNDAIASRFPVNGIQEINKYLVHILLKVYTNSINVFVIAQVAATVAVANASQNLNKF